MKPFVTACVVLGTLALVARGLPRSAGTGSSGAGQEAVERWRKDQAAVYRNLRVRLRSHEIKSGDDVERFFAFCRTKVEPNAAGPLGAELGRLVHSDKFDEHAIDNAAARLESEFEQ